MSELVLSGRVQYPARYFYLVTIITFFIITILSFFSVPLWDYDFWWHISTGRYIYENKALPASDPLSFTSEFSENKNLYPERESFILKQYWLAQVFFYLIYENMGPAGIVILRNLILLSCLILIFFYLYYRKINLFIIFLALGLSFLSLLKFTGERPVLFTIFFSLVTFIIIDLYLWKKNKIFYVLPIILLFWANCHGGFILGDVIIVLFLISEGLKFLFKRTNLSEKDILTLYGVGLFSIIVSGLNPTGFNSFFITFSPEYFPFIKGIQEYVPPFENISKIKLMRPDYGHLILLFLCAFVLILRNLRFDFSYFLILLFLGIVSLKAMRFSIYFSLIGSLIFAIEFNRWLSSIEDKVTLLKKKKTFLDVALISAILLSISLFVIGFGKIRFSFKYLWIPDVSVAGAAEFIKQNNLKNNMLNSYASGGYLSWRLYPEYKTFIDSRGLNLTVMAEYGWIFEGLDSLYKSALPKDKIPLWKRLLDYYKINFIIFELDTFGTVPKLFFKLMQEENWIPVYIDLRSVIFVRNIPEHKKVIDKHKKSFDELVNYLIVKTTVGAMNHEYNPRYLMSLGEIFTKLNRLDDAIKAYKYALKRMPDNEVIKKKIEELEKKKEVER